MFFLFDRVLEGRKEYSVSGAESRKENESVEIGEGSEENRIGIGIEIQV